MQAPAPHFFAIVHAFQNPYNLVVIIYKEGEQLTYGNEKLIAILCKKNKPAEKCCVFLFYIR